MLTRYLGPAPIYCGRWRAAAITTRAKASRWRWRSALRPTATSAAIHAEPIDPRSGIAEPAVFIFPYGILVNKSGERFTDEAPARSTPITRRHPKIYEQRGRHRLLILDPDRRRPELASRPPNRPAAGRRPSRSPSLQSGSDSRKSGSAPRSRPTTRVPRRRVQAARSRRPRDQRECSAQVQLGAADRRAAVPRLADHLRPMCFTFGGLKVDTHARVLDHDGDPIPGLTPRAKPSAFTTAPTPARPRSLRGAVFGRLAGLHASGEAQ